VTFTENQGQWPDSVLFRADTRVAVVWLMRSGLCFQVAHPTAEDDSFRPTEMVHLTFLGSAVVPAVERSGRAAAVSHFFLGSDPGRWRTHVASYSRITYENLYPGIDFVCDGSEGWLTFTLEGLRPGQASPVQATVSGSESLSVTDGGELLLSRPGSGGKIPLSPGLQFETEGLNTFRVSPGRTQSVEASDYFEYRTYLGGTMYDLAQCVDVDDSGFAYVAGRTDAADFPTLLPFQTDSGLTDAFLTKMNRDGDGIVYSTYVGGASLDMGIDVVVDDSGYAYLAGETFSTDFPTPNGWAGYNGGKDVFVIKFTPAGDNVVYGSCLGGNSSESFGGLAVDGPGRAYLVGSTQSADFPTFSPIQGTLSGTSDAFVSKFNAVGGGLVYSTFLGGSLTEQAHTIALDTAGRAYVAGQTLSSNFPLVNPYMTYQGSEDAFVAKLSASGDVLQYSTILAGTGSGSDFIEAIQVDSAENIYVAGTTFSTDFPTLNPYQTDQGLGDAFVTRINASGASLSYSTYLGGSAGDQPKSLAIDERGRAYVAGLTLSADFPTERAHQLDMAGEDAFMAVLDSTGENLLRSTYLGGSGNDWAHSVTLDPLGHIYLAGFTTSTDFPVFNEFQSYGGGTDAYVVRLCGDQDFDCVADAADNCPVTYNPAQEDFDFNGVGDSCDAGNPLYFTVYSPIDMVITDPAGDSIGVDSVSRVIFNTILVGSTYDTLTDENSASLTGPDGEFDDIVTIPSPLVGSYRVRLVREPGASDTATFTHAIRINGNQQLVLDEYRDAAVSALGTPEVPSENDYVVTTTLPGDINANGTTTSSDIILMVNYVFKGGPPPVVPGHGDVNCDGANTSSDIIILVNFVFKNGPQPCSQSGG